MGGGDQRGAGAVEPARGGRAMHAVGGADGVDRHVVDDLLAQQRAVLGGEIVDRLAQRGRELGAVLGLERRERRIDAAREQSIEAAIDREIARLASSCGGSARGSR